jgi:hypothetical protein
MADLSELYDKYVESRNKYPQIKQAAEIAFMTEVVERIKALERENELMVSPEDIMAAKRRALDNSTTPELNDRTAILERMAKARAARKPREAPDAA